jgi:DNA polymerase-1
MKQLFIIDGSSFLYRAYYALKPMSTPQGIPVGAVFGFCRMLKKLMDTKKPDHLIIAWDSPGATERHDLYSHYKETRLSTPTDLYTQKELIQRIATIIGIQQVSISGVEADDIMYSLALDFVAQDYQVVLVTSDKDLGQMVNDHIVIYDTFKDEIYDAAKLEEKYGFPPAKLPFYFSIVGDASDNIPGVAGIGPKGATDLVKQFSSLHDLYAHIDQVKKDRVRELLLTSKEKAFLSEQLFLLRYRKLEVMPDMSIFKPEQWQQARTIFEELDFKSLLKDMGVVTEKVPLSEKHGFIFTAVTQPAEIEKLCAQIREHGACAIDTETDSLAAYQATLVGISLSYKIGSASYIPLAHTTGTNADRTAVDRFLKPLLEDEKVKKYLHNTKFDQLVLSRAGIELKGMIFDTMIAASLITADWQRVGLKFLSSAYLQQEMFTFDDIMKKGNFKNFSEVPIELATEYAASDAHQVIQLVPILQTKLQELGLTNLFSTMELPLTQTLYAMEKEGIILDSSVLQTIDVQVTSMLKRIREDIVTLIGEEYKQVNLNSPKQIEEILFTKLQLTPTKKTTKKTGYSTDQEVLAELAKQHAVPELLLKYRELFKLKSTYLDTLPTYVNQFTGRIHTSFSQVTTATGRLASFDPNLQNIPVNSEIGGLSIRSAFKAPEGELFLAVDYSQIELRVLAYLSQDKNLINAFLENQDVHAKTAAGIFDIPLEAVTHRERQVGKRINFSILYGLTPYGLSKDLGISYSDAEKYIDRYFAQYPQVSSWIASTIQEAKDNGYVTTEWGRRRYIPGIYEKNKTLYDLACRVATNTKAQGTAAEIMKIGMNQLHALFEHNNSGAQIILQIHDELLITVPESKVVETVDSVVDLLQNVVTWNVPLVATANIGKTWGDVSK